jgi:hypothetical protein
VTECECSGCILACALNKVRVWRHFGIALVELEWQFQVDLGCNTLSTVGEKRRLEHQLEGID